mgnify:CR=1 FL=1
MELKIRIKEVKEETWNLTIEEECMFLFAKDKTPAYSMVVNRAKHKLEEIGLVDVCRLNEGGISVGVFRTETIRDATPGEVMAWHVLQSVNACDVLTCEKCITNGSICICDMMIYDDSYELLKGKEVILELV